MSIYRVDKFIVSEAAKMPLLHRLAIIKRLLDSQPGCRQNLVLEQTSGPGRYNVVTIVEWDNEQVMLAARAVAQAAYAAENFDPAAFMQSLDVEADMANYEIV